MSWSRVSLSPHQLIPAGPELRRNALAGVVVGVIALPLSIALAVAVGVPPIAGLYTAAFAGATASMFGGSRFNITGPTAALVPLLHGIVLQHGAEALPLVGAMAGLLLVLMGVLRFGRLIRYMPGLVVVGFTAGIALSIGFGQLNSFAGIEGVNPDLEHFHDRTLDTLRHLGAIDAGTLFVGLASLGVLIAWPRLVPRVPAALVAVVGATALAWAAGIETPTVGGRYGALPTGLPLPSFDFVDLGLAIQLLPAAFAIAVLAGVESLLSAVVADGMSASSSRHNPDRELVGQGLANLVSPMMSGIPATAAIARTAAGVQYGASSRWTGVFHSMTVLSLTLLFGEQVGRVPLAALAAILLVVAWNIADVAEMRKLVRGAPREDVAVLLSTMLITLFFDLTYAIGFGVVLSAVLLVRRLASVPAAAELLPDPVSGRVEQVPDEVSRLITARPDIAFFNAQGVLSFHCAAAFEYQLSGQDHRPLVLRMKDVHGMDSSGLLTLEGIIEHRQRSGARIVLSAVNPELYPTLDRFGIVGRLGPTNVFPSTAAAVQALTLEPHAASRPVTSRWPAPSPLDCQVDW